MKERILFVCQCNLNRSPTFKKWLEQECGDEYEISSAGIDYGYPYCLRKDKSMLLWADKVFVMDMEQYIWIYNEIGKQNMHKIEVIGISDQYDPDEGRLIELIKFWWTKVKRGHI